MKKTIQTKDGFQQVDSDTNPEYFNNEEQAVALREKRMDGIIAKAISLGWIT